MPFAPGKSGNPSGRPRFTLPDGRSLRDVCREHTETAVNALISIASNEEAPPAARVGAATSLLDRGWGKPTQPISGDDEAPPIRHQLDLTSLSEETLREIATAEAK